MLSFTQSLMTEMLTHLKNSFTAASKLVFDQRGGHHSLGKVIYKINHHSAPNKRQMGHMSLVKWALEEPRARIFPHWEILSY